jgi:hypothetical protein
VVIETTEEEHVAANGELYTKAPASACWQFHHSGPQWFTRPWLVGAPAFDETIISSVVNDAIVKVKEAIWDVGTDVAQLQQLARFAGQQWNRVNYYAIKAALRAKKKYKSWKEVVPAFASYWLEYRYGWRPILFSVEDAMEAYNSELEKGSYRRGYTKLLTELDDSATDNWTFDGAYLGVGVGTQTLSGERTYRGMAIGSVDSNSIRWGADPLLTTWELIPYSFVVDWFLNVGNWLNAVSPFSGAHIEGSQCSVKDDYVLRQENNRSWSGTSATGAHNGVVTELRVQRYERFAQSASSLPVWNPRLSPARILDVAALVLSGSRRVRHLLHN